MDAERETSKERIIAWWKRRLLYRTIDASVSRKFKKKLKNENFTILCNNCIGGCIYHRLGQQFQSPTVNLFMNVHEFISFCLHLDYYLTQQLQFSETEFNYPVGELRGDESDEIPTIHIHFNHDKVQQSACEKWERRKERIRKDNLYIILYRWDGITEEEIRRLENYPCRNKVILTSKPLPNISWSYYIKPNYFYKDADNYLAKDIFGIRYYEKKFDFVSFVN
jgi:uncharacterized protein (DUF1919 family)